MKIIKNLWMGARNNEGVWRVMGRLGTLGAGFDTDLIPGTFTILASVTSIHILPFGQVNYVSSRLKNLSRYNEPRVNQAFRFKAV